jgi:hypothetical protein
MTSGPRISSVRRSTWAQGLGVLAVWTMAFAPVVHLAHHALADHAGAVADAGCAAHLADSGNAAFANSDLADCSLCTALSRSRDFADPAAAPTLVPPERADVFHPVSLPPAYRDLLVSTSPRAPPTRLG